MNCYGYYVFFADDLDISPDFFEYFAATYPILVADPTLWCVSAWNDNGKGNMVGDEPGKNITKLFISYCLNDFMSFLAKVFEINMYLLLHLSFKIKVYEYTQLSYIAMLFM